MSVAYTNMIVLVQSKPTYASSQEHPSLTLVISPLCHIRPSHVATEQACGMAGHIPAMPTCRSSESLAAQHAIGEVHCRACILLGFCKAPKSVHVCIIRAPMYMTCTATCTLDLKSGHFAFTGCQVGQDIMLSCFCWPCSVVYQSPPII